MIEAGATLRPLLVSADEAARLLGVGRSLFFELKSSGRIPLEPIRFGRKRLYRVEDLENFVRAGCPARWTTEDSRND